MTNTKKEIGYVKIILKSLMLLVASGIILFMSNMLIYNVYGKIYLIINGNGQISQEQLQTSIMTNPLFLGVASLAYIIFLTFLFIFVKKRIKEV